MSTLYGDHAAQAGKVVGVATYEQLLSVEQVVDQHNTILTDDASTHVVTWPVGPRHDRNSGVQSRCGKQTILLQYQH